jgi:hypothetical protein
VRKSRDGKRTSLFARALAGGDVVSFNLYRLRSGEDSLRPCEMPAEKVVAFVLGYQKARLSNRPQGISYADLHAIGRRGGKELQPIGVLRRPTRENRMIERHFIPSRLVGTYEKPRRVPKSLCWVHPALASRSHHMKLPRTLGDGRCDRVEFSSSEPA